MSFKSSLKFEYIYLDKLKTINSLVFFYIISMVFLLLFSKTRSPNSSSGWQDGRGKRRIDPS